MVTPKLPFAGDLPSLDAATVASLADPSELRRAIVNLYAGPHVATGRRVDPLDEAAGSKLLTMPGIGVGVATVKVVTVVPENPAAGRPLVQGVCVAFDRSTGSPIAVLDGAAVTAVRTPAVSAVATDALAGSGCRSLGIVGAGVQGFGHAVAIAAVRTLDDVVIASRSERSAVGLVASLRTLGLPARVGGVPDAAGCQIVCLCTSSHEPVVEDSWLRGDAQIIAVGSFIPEAREVSAATVGRATVYVDDVEGAIDEAGDLIQACTEGMFSWDRVAGSLADLSRTVRAGRAGLHEPGAVGLTLFKSVGAPAQDAAVVEAILARAGLVDQGRGSALTSGSTTGTHASSSATGGVS